MKALSFGGILVLLCLSLLLTGAGIADAINLQADTVKGLSHQAKPTTVSPPVKAQEVLGCPKLVAQELHIVRIVPQKTSTGEQAYRYILNGTVQNRGLAGVAAAGLNVSQKTQQGAVKRIALKLFKQRVQPNQRFDISGDFHVQVQSEPILPTTNPLPSFTLNVTNLRNDSGQCADSHGTEVHITPEAVRQALPAQLRGGVSQHIDAVKQSKNIINWTQPDSASRAKQKTTNVNVGAHSVALPQSSAAAANAKRVGEDAERTKQIQQMQKMRDLGSPMDQARRGPAGRQDCQHSSDPAACLQSNLHSPNQQGQPGSGRGSIQECIMGPNPSACFNSGGQNSQGRAGRGPGDPRDQIKDPRSVSSVQVGSYDTGPVKDWSRWDIGHWTHGETYRTRSGQNGNGDFVQEEIIINPNRNEVTHEVRVEKNGETTVHRVVEDSYDRTVEETHTVRHQHDDPENSQGTPDGSNSQANDNCDWNPALGKCMKPRADAKGNTSQPGADGSNPGSATPHIGSEAVTNGGGGDWNTTDGRAFGLGNGSKPLDMKDPGGLPGGVTPK